MVNNLNYVLGKTCFEGWFFCCCLIVSFFGVVVLGLGGFFVVEKPQKYLKAFAVITCYVLLKGT